MKNIFYLSVLVIFLASCKGSSFLKQRYTHLGHSVAKNTTDKKPINKNSELANKSTAPAEKSNELNSVLIAKESEAEKPANVEQKTKVASSEPVVNFKNKKLQALYEKANVFKLETKKEIGFKDKKLNSENQKTLAAMGVIKKVLKIIILILVLAIVLALIVLAATING